MIGVHLEGYRIRALLGRGAAGTVYRAETSGTGVMRAVRLLHPEAHADTRRREAFVAAARAILELGHPSLPPVVEVIATPSATAVVMELLQGETLAERLRRRPVEPEEAARIVDRVSAGLRAAHEAGVLHLDVKPADIFLEDNGGIRLLDFALAPPAADREGKHRDLAALEALPSLMAGWRRMRAALPAPSPHRVPSRPAARRSGIAAAAVLCALLGAGITRQLPPAGGHGPYAGEGTLAVLPFRSPGMRADVAPRDAGLTVSDAIITSLADSDGLKVRPTIAVTRFAGPAVEPIAAGRSLGVARILSGELSLHESGWRARIRMDDVATGRNVWMSFIDSGSRDFDEACLLIRDHVVRQITSLPTAGPARSVI